MTTVLSAVKKKKKENREFIEVKDLSKNGYNIFNLLCEIVMSYLLCSSCGPLKKKKRVL